MSTTGPLAQAAACGETTRGYVRDGHATRETRRTLVGFLQGHGVFRQPWRMNYSHDTEMADLAYLEMDHWTMDL